MKKKVKEHIENLANIIDELFEEVKVKYLHLTEEELNILKLGYMEGVIDSTYKRSKTVQYKGILEHTHRETLVYDPLKSITVK